MRQFTMTLGQVNFFYSILNNQKLCPMADLGSMRKANKVFDSIESTVVEFELKINKLKKEFGEKIRKEKNERGQEVKIKYIPLSTKERENNREEYLDKLEELGKPTKTFHCEREALEFVKRMFSEVPKRLYKKGNDKESESGLGGRYNIKMFSEVVSALEDAREVDKHTKK